MTAIESQWNKRSQKVVWVTRTSRCSELPGSWTVSIDCLLFSAALHTKLLKTKGKRTQKQQQRPTKQSISSNPAHNWPHRMFSMATAAANRQCYATDRRWMNAKASATYWVNYRYVCKYMYVYVSLRTYIRVSTKTVKSVSKWKQRTMRAKHSVAWYYVNANTNHGSARNEQTVMLGK